jgi:hypothetical protein
MTLHLVKVMSLRLAVCFCASIGVVNLGVRDQDKVGFPLFSSAPREGFVSLRYYFEPVVRRNLSEGSLPPETSAII